MKNLVKILIYGSMAFIFVITSCSDSEDSVIINPPVEVEGFYPRTELLSIKSNSVFDNYTYPIKIYLPASYKTNKNLPIIYILDGTLNLEKVKNNLGSNNEAIIVGIGDFASKAEWQRRWADYIPGNNCSGAQGKHLDFYKFITKELVPRIDFNYYNDHNSRSLMGHSSAGLFTLVSMFLEDSENVMFYNFIASDPELGCDQDYFVEMLHDYDFSDGAKKFKLYMALSITGTIGAVRKFAEDIQEQEYTWLTFKYEEFLNVDHMGVVDPSFKSGLKFIFDE
jgi:predicted alpha/beta superfamily hydrolase